MAVRNDENPYLEDPNERSQMRYPTERRPLQFSLRAFLLAVLLTGIVTAFGLEAAIPVGGLLLILWLSVKGRIAAAFGVFLVFLTLLLFEIGTSYQVSLATGDQRTCWWGIPVAYIPMEQRAREALLSLRDHYVPRSWVRCATKVGSNNPDRMVVSYYFRASAWVAVDPEIAKLVVRDIADWFQKTRGAHGFPECHAMIWIDVVESGPSGPRVIDGWDKNQAIQNYLAAKGYDTERATRGHPPDGT